MDLSQKLPNLALFMDVGTGKTRTTIEILRYRCAAHKMLLKTLIFVPKIVCTNWQREIAKYSKIHKYDVHVLLGTGLQRAHKFRQEVCENSAPTKRKIVITNYEAVQMPAFFELLKLWQPEVVIADECHRLKNPESKRAQRVIQLADTAQYRYALTGTPILNSAMDIFNIFRFLDRGDTFGKNFWKFRSVWFEDENAAWAGQANYFPKYVPRAETYSELHNLIYKKAVRAIKSECLDLPPFLRKEVHVELGKEQAKLYKDLKDNYIAYIDEKLKSNEPRAVVAQLAVVKALRLMQLVTGYAKADDDSIHKIEDNPRLQALSELLEELTPNHKVIVWSVFHENYTDIRSVCEKLGVEYGELHGKVNQKDRESALNRFRGDPKCRVLIANQAAGGVGINLIESDVCIYYSKNFSLEQDIQSEGRNYRGGSERHTSVTRIDIVALGTIDELVTQALAAKQEVAGKVLDWRDKL